MRNQLAKIIKLHILFSLHIYSLYVHKSSDIASGCGCCLRIHDIVVHVRLGLRLSFALPSLKTCSCLQEGCWASWLDQNLVFICLFNFNNGILHETPNISPLAWSILCAHMLACIQQLYFAWDTKISSLAWCQPCVPYVKHDYLYKWEVCAFVHTEPSPLLGGLGGRRTLNPKSNL